MGKKPLHIRLDKIDGFIEIYGVIRYLVLLGFKEVYDKIKCLISEKVVLLIILIVILQESELIHIILYL